MSENEGQNFLALEKILPVEKHFEAGVKMERRQGETMLYLFPPVGEAVLTKA